VPPLAHCYGLYQVFEAFSIGGRLVLEKNFAFPAKTIGLLEREGITAFAGSAAIFAFLLKYRGLLQRPLPALVGDRNNTVCGSVHTCDELVRGHGSGQL
jgi:hypothetical protein